MNNSVHDISAQRDSRSRRFRPAKRGAVLAGCLGLIASTGSSSALALVMNGIDYPEKLPVSKKYNRTNQYRYVAVDSSAYVDPAEACRRSYDFINNSDAGQIYFFDGLELEPPLYKNFIPSYNCIGHIESVVGSTPPGHLGYAVPVCPKPYMAYVRFDLKTETYYKLAAVVENGKPASGWITKVVYGPETGRLYTYILTPQTLCLYPQVVTGFPDEIPVLPNSFGFNETVDRAGAEAALTPLIAEASGGLTRTIYPAAHREELNLRVRIALGGGLLSKPLARRAKVRAAFPNGVGCALRPTAITKKNALFTLKLKVKNGKSKITPGQCDSPGVMPSVAGGPLHLELGNADPSTPAAPLLEGTF